MTEKNTQDKNRLEEAVSGKKGFTLVELIVVLVILAILAAILVPALLGWIDKAKEKGVILECRAVVQASQATATEIYGKKGDVTVFDMRMSETKAEILKLADVTGSIQNISINSDHIINYLRYSTADGIVVTYDINADVRYVIGSSYSPDAKGYYDWASDAASDKNLNYDKAGEEELIKIFQEQNGGTLPGLTETEKSIISKLNGDALVWYPIMAQGTVVLRASAGPSNHWTPLIFYNGSYYYHTNGYGAMDGSTIMNNGVYDTTPLDEAPSSKDYDKSMGASWVKYEP